MKEVSEDQDLWKPKGAREDWERALKELGPLHHDPEELVLSLDGAREEAWEIAKALAQNLVAEETAPKLKVTIEGVGRMAKAARELANAMKDANQTEWILLGQLGGHPTFDTPEYALWEAAGVIKLPHGMEHFGVSQVSEGWVQDTHALAEWLEHMHTKAKKRPTSGPGSAVSRLIVTPYQDHVYRCRLLLMACGRKHGGTKGGPLSRLAVALRAYATGLKVGGSALNREVQKEGESDPLQYAVARCQAMSLVCRDVVRRRGKSALLAKKAQAEFKTRRKDEWVCAGLPLDDLDREQDPTQTH